ncbi:MAG: ATP-binding protein [Candidatus Thorarchaeota archaeon]
MHNIFGREKEKNKLAALLKSNEPQFLALYGRRRTGKTYLIRNFFKGQNIYFEMTGSKRASTKEQLFNFKHAFKDAFSSFSKPINPKNWTEALFLLWEAIKEVSKKNKKIILFFDEVPWIATKRSNFLPALEHLWNRYLSNQKNVILIICGSAASWIIDKVIDNRGGLYGRLTEVIHLHPFNLLETENFLQSLGIKWDRQQIVDLYLAFGGVAKYLTFVKRGWSAAQAIQNQIVDCNGLMHREFDRLFESLFDHDERHRKVVQLLASKRKGFPQKSLIKKTGLSSGGNSYHIIKELEQSGFLTYIPRFGDKKYGGDYRLTDEYSLFYLYWINTLKNRSLMYGQKDYWMQMQNSKSWLSWSGYAFETVCLKHISQIKKALGINGVITYQTGWRSSTNSKGAEIDLLIERADGCINLCEIKFSRGLFTITKSYAESLKRKKLKFIEETNTNKAIFITLITPHGVKENNHFHFEVDKQLMLDDLFSQ